MQVHDRLVIPPFEKLFIPVILQTKKGVKRKADTTTPGGVIRTPGYDSSFDQVAPAKPSTKASSAETVAKKPKKEAVEDPKPVGGKAPIKLSESLEYCREILKELHSTEHSVS